MKCWECHGENSRGNGPNAPRLKTKDGKNDPILPADLSKFWRYKGGNTANDVYMRFNTGLNGTPMPSFTDSLSDEERWHLANYIVSLQKTEVKEGVLKAKLIKGEIPSDTENLIWANAEPVDIRLSGQVVVAPRWENASVDLVTVKAVYNDKEIGFLFEWSDRFKDTAHKKEMEVNFEISGSPFCKTGRVSFLCKAAGDTERYREFQGFHCYPVPCKTIRRDRKASFC